MRRLITFILFINCTVMMAQSDLERDVFQTARGDLTIYFVGHGTLMFDFNGMIIHIDPTMREYDYSKMPAADLILITHHHGDHLDATALNHIRKSDTKTILTEVCLENLKDPGETIVMKNGDRQTILDIPIEALPSYNMVHKRPGGEPYHPRGIGNAYLVELGNKRVLIGGDTENIPELKVLKDIDIAFLPMNLPYTMTPEMVADLARAIQPKILYPYHFGQTNTDELVELMKDEKNIDVRIRDLR